MRCSTALLVCGLVSTLSRSAHADEPNALKPADRAPASARDPQTAEAWRELAPAEAELLMKVQSELGGPLVDRALPSSAEPMSEDGPARVAPPRERPLDRRTPEQVRALRAAARKSEEAAAHLEDLSLYEQADLLRDAAQRLRLDARELAGDQRDRSAPAPSGFSESAALRGANLWKLEPDPRPNESPTSTESAGQGPPNLGPLGRGDERPR